MLQHYICRHSIYRFFTRLQNDLDCAGCGRAALNSTPAPTARFLYHTCRLLPKLLTAGPVADTIVSQKEACLWTRWHYEGVAGVHTGTAAVCLPVSRECSPRSNRVWDAKTLHAVQRRPSDQWSDQSLIWGDGVSVEL